MMHIRGKKNISIFNINISNYVNNYQFELYTSLIESGRAELASFNIQAMIRVHKTLRLIFKSRMSRAYAIRARVRLRAACSLNPPASVYTIQYIIEK
jgi:hypothetical protein